MCCNINRAGKCASMHLSYDRATLVSAASHGLCDVLTIQDQQCVWCKYSNFYDIHRAWPGSSLVVHLLMTSTWITYDGKVCVELSCDRPCSLVSLHQARTSVCVRSLCVSGEPLALVCTYVALLVGDLRSARKGPLWFRFRNVWEQCIMLIS